MTTADERRLAAESGHRGDERAARTRLAHDDPGVRATALAALVRMEKVVPADLATALADPHPAVRRRACQLAAAWPEVELLSHLADGDTSVVEMAAWALGERGDSAAVAHLAQVATAHRDALCREAAVAALGAIGAPAGLPAILTATTDKPAVRRRAVIALAPFDGPEVDAALHRALEDRDRQVRQAAEDLLAP